MIRLKNIDWMLLAIVLALSAIGLVLVYSATFRASIYREVNFFERQLSWVFIGFIVMFLSAALNYQWWGRITYILYLAGLIFLLIVLIRGRIILGAQRWLEVRISPLALKSIGFQPSEFIKIIIVMTLARLAIDNNRKMNSWVTLGKALGLLLLPIALILKQPDLGTAMLSLSVGLTLLYLMGVRPRKILALIMAGVISSPLAWSLLKDYQKERLRIFLNPYRDPLGSGYSMIQSRLAIGSGRLLGKGWLSGTQTQLDFVPEHHTDFIFTVLGEEWGYLGALLVLGLYLFLILRALRIATQAKDRFGLFLATGLILILAFHVIINIGVAIGLFPITGLPLPFLSYGGSSLVSSMLAIGIIQNIYIRRSVFK